MLCYSGLEMLEHTQYKRRFYVLERIDRYRGNSFQLFFGLSTLQFPRALMGGTRNTSITHWRKDAFEEYNILPTWFLEQYNDAMHLRDIDSTTRIPWQEISAKPVDNNEKPEVPTDV